MAPGCSAIKHDDGSRSIAESAEVLLDCTHTALAAKQQELELGYKQWSQQKRHEMKRRRQEDKRLAAERKKLEVRKAVVPGQELACCASSISDQLNLMAAG